MPMPSTSISIVIAHYVFLDKESRYALNDKQNTNIQTIGWCTPTWCKGSPSRKRKWISEPVKEIICQYTVTNQLDDKVIDIRQNGFCIHLTTDNICSKLLDIKDMGCESINFAYRAFELVESNEFPIVHFVNINDMNVLRQSLVC